MLEALREKYEGGNGEKVEFSVKIRNDNSRGAEVCRFVIWKSEGEDEWEKYTEYINRRVLEAAKK